MTITTTDTTGIDAGIGSDIAGEPAAGIRIARTDGILVGPTTGAALHAASVWGKEHPGRAVVISGDNAAKYVSAYAAYL